MRTEGFCSLLAKGVLLIAVLALSHPAQAQRVAALSSTRVSGGIQPVSLTSEPQNSQSLSTIRVPALPSYVPSKSFLVPTVEKQPSKRAWLILSAVQHGAAGFDAYSTRVAISHGAVEKDPLLRPFAGSSAMYFANQVGPVALDLVARRMQRSNNRFVRRMWWVPQMVTSVDFIYCGFHNLGVASHQ